MPKGRAGIYTPDKWSGAKMGPGNRHNSGGKRKKKSY